MKISLFPKGYSIKDIGRMRFKRKFIIFRVIAGEILFMEWVIMEQKLVWEPGIFIRPVWDDIKVVGK